MVNEDSLSDGHWCQRLYEDKAAALLLYGRALGLSHSEAEDVLQDTFVALLRRPFPPDNPEHYCLRSYRNRAFSYKRGLWQRLRREWESRRWFEPSPRETAREREAMKRLAGLPREQREVIVLKIWHEYTFEAIGEMLDISPHTAAGRYRYGMQKLRHYLKGQAYEREEAMGDGAPILESPTAVAQD